MTDPLKMARTISTLKISLIVIGMLVVLCNVHAAVELWHEYHVDLGFAQSQAHAASITDASVLHCTPPDDMGFMTCKGGP